MTTTTLPADIPQAFLEGEFGRAVLDEYKGRVMAKYEDNRVLRVSNYEGSPLNNNPDNLVIGSNPFAVVLVNEIIREQGLRTATQADLERILKANVLDLRGGYGRYADSALILRSENEPNSYLAKKLAKQLKEVLGREYKLPIMINLCDIELEKDKNSNYGLAFRLREDAKPIYAPILSSREKNDSILSRFSSEDIDEETGLPKRLDEGDRKLDNYNLVYNSIDQPTWTCRDGLCRLVLATVKNAFSKSGWHLNLSTWKDLDRSGGAGRVVVVRDSARDLKK